MKASLCGLAALQFVASMALAQELVRLNDTQMDKVTAGFLEFDFSNTSATAVSIFQRAYLTDSTPNSITCPGCYLLINSPTFSVAAQFGAAFSPGTQFPP